MNPTRREAVVMGVKTTLGLALAGLPGPWGRIPNQGETLAKAIPSTGERIPVVGLGTASSFGRAAGNPSEQARIRDVLRQFLELGGTFIDTAPIYGASEEVIGRTLRDLGAAGDVNLAVGHVGAITGVQPVIVKQRARRLWIAVVAAGGGWAAKLQAPLGSVRSFAIGRSEEHTSELQSH